MPDRAVTFGGGSKRGSRALLRSVLGEALRRARLEQGRTLRDVAVAARVSMPYLSEVERGLKEVSSEVLAALCEALGIDLAELLGAVIVDLTSGIPVASLGIAPRHPVVQAPPVIRRGDAYALAA